MPAVQSRLADNFGVDEIRARVRGWPSSVLKRIEIDVEALYPGAWCRLLTAWQCGLLLSTGYSGIDAPGVAMSFIERELQKLGVDIGIGFNRSDATDIGLKCRQFLKSFP